MTDAIDVHPDDSDLMPLAAGDVGELPGHVGDHLRKCPACQVRVQALQAEVGVLREVIACLGTAEPLGTATDTVSAASSSGSRGDENGEPLSIGRDDGQAAAASPEGQPEDQHPSQMAREWDQTIDDLLEAFEEVWTPSAPLVVEDFVLQRLPQDVPETLRLAVLMALARADFEMSLASRPTTRAHDWLKQHEPWRYFQPLAAELFALEYNFRKNNARLTLSEFLQEVPPEFREVVGDRLAPPPRYVSHAQLSVGGQGEIWRSIDQELGREVAVKVLRVNFREDRHARQRLVSEAQITSQLEHPGIVPVYGLEEDAEDGRPRYAMRFVRGDTLTARIQAFHALRQGVSGGASVEAHRDREERNDLSALGRRPPISSTELTLRFRELIAHLIAVCKTVAFAHAHPRVFVHRDLKPDNVMVGEYGETIVMDWGLARPLAELRSLSGSSQGSQPGSRREPSPCGVTVSGVTASGETTQVYARSRPPDSAIWDHPPADARGRLRTREGELVGTPAYMSPEQAGATLVLDQRTDVFGLGAILYYILTNRPPHQAQAGESLQDSLKRIQQRPAEAPRAVATWVPRPLDAVCRKALSLRPDDRYATAVDMARDLERYLAGEALVAYREPWHERWWRLARKYPRRIAIAAGATAVTVLTLVFMLWYVAYAEALAQRRAQIASLPDQDARAVPAIISDLGSDVWRRRQIERELDRQLTLAKQSGDAKHQRRMQLAMLPFRRDESHLAAIFAGLPPVPDLEEVRLTIDVLARWTEPASLKAHLPKLWSLPGDIGESADRRLRAACVLAQLDPNATDWEHRAALVADLLVTADGRTAEQAIDLLQPVSNRLRGELMRVFANSDHAAMPSQVAAAALSAHAFSQRQITGDRLEEFVELVTNASARQHVILLDRLPPSAQGALLAVLEHRLHSLAAEIATIDAELAGLSFLPGNAPSAAAGAASGTAEELSQLDHRKERLASQQANAAAAVLRLDESRFDWSWLRHSKDPRLRTLLIHRIPQSRIAPHRLTRRLTQETDASTRRALLLALGQYRRGDLASTEIELIKRRFRAPDAGEHAAADWALRQLGEEKWVQDESTARLRPDRAATSPSAVGTLASPTTTLWWVNTRGHTMVVIPSQPEGHFFWMGAQPHEKGYAAAEEPRYRAHVGGSFAISATETTVEQMERCFPGFRQLQDDHRKHADRTRPDDATQRHEPASFAPLLHAMAYCNWLSQQVGLPRTQWCYDPDELAKAMVLAKNNESVANESDNIAMKGDTAKAGYRLPTELEWEYACRAGTETTRFYGGRDDLLDHYAFHRGNSTTNTLAQVASRMPNDLGLFDTLGNVSEWTMKATTGGASSGPRRTAKTGDFRFAHPLRGGTLNDEAVVIRCSYRMLADFDVLQREFGFRVARTVDMATIPAAAVEPGVPTSLQEGDHLPSSPSEKRP